jgi:DNA-binding CsgD family transcriptional regulator
MAFALSAVFGLEMRHGMPTADLATKSLRSHNVLRIWSYGKSAWESCLVALDRLREELVEREQ